jgi:hypothetical protein
MGLLNERGQNEHEELKRLYSEFAHAQDRLMEKRRDLNHVQCEVANLEKAEENAKRAWIKWQTSHGLTNIDGPKQ